MKYKGTPVYLRDLNDEARRDVRSRLTGKALVAAVEGEDVVIGYYLPMGKEYPASDKD